MKDEEMAEEYAGNECKDCTYRCDKPNMFKRLSNKKECHAYFRSYESFLAGLKAGRPQWHDLRKDPNDLPPKRVPRTDCVVKVLNPQCSVTVLDTLGNRVWFNYRNNRWRKEPFEEIEVIAWCEIPTFDKE